MILTVDEAATRRKVSRTMIMKYIESGKLPAKKNRYGFWEIDSKALAKFKPAPKGRPRNGAKK